MFSMFLQYYLFKKEIVEKLIFSMSLQYYLFEKK